MEFIIDTKGQKNLLSNEASSISSDDSDDEFQFLPMSQRLSTNSVRSRNSDEKRCSEIDLDDTYLDFGDGTVSNGPDRKSKVTTRSLARCLTNPETILKKSILQPGVEKLHSLPTYDEGRRQLLKKRKAEREKSAGKNWFNMKATELTEEMKNDLEVLKMRSSLDPKHFYKKNDFKNLPKYFQVGRVVESAADFYSSRIPKKDRKKTLVDELLADAEFQKTTKKRYKEIIAEQRKTNYKAHRQAKRLKKKK